MQAKARTTSIHDTAPIAATRRTLLHLTAGALCILSSFFGEGDARADSRPEFVVIVHAQNPVASVGRAYLADLYLKRATRWEDGELARPVDQRADSTARRSFSDSVLKRSVAAVKRYWQQRIFSGRDLPPPELDGDEAVVSYVASHRGAIGYVSGNAKLEKTKLVPLR